MKWLSAIALAAIVAGCSKSPSELGGPVSGTPSSIQRVLGTTPGGPVVVQGTMTTKCPVAGCWFILSEGSRSVKVDTKEAGFVVVDVPVDTAMVVAGLLTTNGEERVIKATGLRY